MPLTNKRAPKLRICRQRRKIWFVSLLAVLLSLIGMTLSVLNPQIGKPLRPGLDFTGGTQIRIERNCIDSCDELTSLKISEALNKISFPMENNISPPNISGARIQLIDNGKSLAIRLPFLTTKQSKTVIEVLRPIAGPFQDTGQSIDTIGPTLGKQLLKSSVLSLLVAFSAIAIYIGFRYDKRFAALALIALAHDVLIICGIFSWLGIYLSLEVDSLFAVSLLTIAGYSVNDTVVVFDRIREISLQEDRNILLKEQIDLAVSATLTRTLYTSGTTLLPLIALIFFGGTTLYWFSISLAIGVVVGSWSSIALAPSLLSLWELEPSNLLNTNLENNSTND